MIGRLYRNEQGWYYVEVLFRGRNVEFVMTAPCVAELSAEVLGNRAEHWRSRIALVFGWGARNCETGHVNRHGTKRRAP
jgi:hypothetical protein